MKGAAAMLLAGLCLPLLSACDARQWPMGDRYGKPAGKPTGRAAPARRQVASATATAPTGVQPPLDLIGLNSTQLVERLGQPEQQLDRAPAQVWRYRTARCTLDVSLYPDVNSQIFRILSYEVNGDDGTDQGKRRCAAELQSRARSR